MRPAAPPSEFEPRAHLITARSPEDDLIRVTRIPPRGIDLVGQISHAERDPSVVDGDEIRLWNIDEDPDVRHRIFVHDDEVVVEIEAVADMTDRRADFDRPAGCEAIGCARVGDKPRYVGRRLARK